MAALPPRWGRRICRVINLLLKWKYGGGGKFSKSGEPCSKNFLLILNTAGQSCKETRLNMFFCRRQLKRLQGEFLKNLCKFPQRRRAGFGAKRIWKNICRQARENRHPGVSGKLRRWFSLRIGRFHSSAFCFFYKICPRHSGICRIWYCLPREPQ